MANDFDGVSLRKHLEKCPLFVFFSHCWFCGYWIRRSLAFWFTAKMMCFFGCVFIWNLGISVNGDSNESTMSMICCKSFTIWSSLYLPTASVFFAGDFFDWKATKILNPKFLRLSNYLKFPFCSIGLGTWGKNKNTHIWKMERKTTKEYNIVENSKIVEIVSIY